MNKKKLVENPEIIIQESQPEPKISTINAIAEFKLNTNLEFVVLKLYGYSEKTKQEWQEEFTNKRIISKN